MKLEFIVVFSTSKYSNGLVLSKVSEMFKITALGTFLKRRYTGGVLKHKSGAKKHANTL